MLKLGIYNLEQLAGPDRGVLGKYLRRTCYVGLYEEAGSIEGESGRRLEEKILSGFTVANGVFKRTSKDRMGPFDESVIAAAMKLTLHVQPLVVHDMAVSDARTACDFFLKLSAELDDSIEFYATDLVLRVKELRRSGGHTRVVVDGRNNILQLICPPFVLPMRAIEPWLFPINRILRIVLIRTAARQILRLHQRGDPRIRQRELPLICCEARNLLKSRANFHLDEYDLFERTSRRYNLVRAMNIFNLRYFPLAAIEVALLNIFESLDENALLVVGSNGDAGSTVNGGIYAKRMGRFSLVYSSGSGAAINDIVLRIGRTK